MTRLARAARFTGILVLGAASSVACSKDEAPADVPTSTGMTRWVKTDLRTAGLAQVRLGAARLAETCKSEASEGIGAAVSGAVGVAAMLPTFPETLATTLACALDAPRGATCSELSTCAGKGATPGANPTCDSQTLLVRMGEKKVPAAIACAAFGEKCFTTRVGGMCGLSVCLDGETYDCDGDAIVSCVQGVRRRVPCGQGMTCGTQSGSGMTDCIGSGGSCSGGDHCDGDTLVRCVRPPGGKGLEARINCKDWGLGCAASGGHAGCAVNATECASGKDLAVCDGKALKMCVAGHWWKVACDSLVAGTSCKDGAGASGEAGCEK